MSTEQSWFVIAAGEEPLVLDADSFGILGLQVATVDAIRGLSTGAVVLPGRIRNDGRLETTKSVVMRSLRLFALGVFIQGGFLHGYQEHTYGVDLSAMRLPGILQRIAFTYLVAGVCEIWLPINQSVNTSLPEYQRLPECTDASPYSGELRADAPNWCLPVGGTDPEGLLGALTACLCTLIGAHFGHVLKTS
eukprot:gene9589-11357_t